MTSIGIAGLSLLLLLNNTNPSNKFLYTLPVLFVILKSKSVVALAFPNQLLTASKQFIFLKHFINGDRLQCT